MIIIYVYVLVPVMQKELDRIERYGKQVTEKASLSKSAGEALLKDIQVRTSSLHVSGPCWITTAVSYCRNLSLSIVSC